MLYLFDEFALSDEEFSLTRNGKRLPLEPRALGVLLVLAGGQGRLFTKKALLQAVWKDTFVEETTLTRAVALIRKQLEDDPRAPKFIETVPTRGYRFIAPVAMKEAAAPPREALAVSAPSAGADVRPDESATPASAQLRPAPIIDAPIQPVHQGLRQDRSAWRIGGFVFAATACLVVMVAFFMRRAHQPSRLSTRDIIVLGDFVNNSGDPVFDDALRQGMLVQLEQSPVLRLASEGQIRGTLKLMGLRSDAAVTPEVGREICQRLGGTVVLDGSIARLGREYVLGLRARQCSSGEELAAEQVQVAQKEGALSALGGIATRFRTRIGEASDSVRELDTPLPEATTSSLDALKAYSQGIRYFNAQGSAAAAPLFQRAAELDNNFAAAYVWLARIYADLGQEALSIESAERAYALRDRASDRERFLIEASYNTLVSGNLEKARAACDAWVQMYPRDVYARAFRSGVIYPAYGQYERALQEASESIAVDPQFVIGYRNAVMNLINLNRLDEAQQVLQQAAERKVYLPSFVTDLYRIAFLRNDQGGMRQALDAAPRNPWLQYYQAATLAQAGHLTQARTLQEQALRLSRHGGRHDVEAQLQVGAAFIEVLYGYPDKATVKIHMALQLSKGRAVQAAAALALAMAGNVHEASELAADLRKRFPEDTLLQYEYLPAIDASIALTHKQPKRALELLEETSQFELSLPLYPVYLRGEAYLALGRAAEAAAEFRKIVDHPGLVMNDPLYNLAEIHLARAYKRAGEREHAKATYQAIRRWWQSAEASLPILMQVKEESSDL